MCIPLAHPGSHRRGHVSRRLRYLSRRRRAGSLAEEGWSTLQLNATFVSSTFIGMTLGAWFSGILGDRFGRRFTYQVNLVIFGLASIAAAFAPSMTVLIACRFVIGIGLGAEIVVGYATLTEFVPASSRGVWIGLLAVITNFSLFVSSMVGLWVIPTLGWRYMFGIVGVLAMFVWILRKSMPESPRWLAAHGRGEEAEKILQAIETEAARKGPLPPVQSISREQQPAGSVWKLFQPPYLGRTLLGSLCFGEGSIHDRQGGPSSRPNEFNELEWSR